MDYHRETGELQCTSHGFMHITYGETCVNVNNGNARMGNFSRTDKHSLISRGVWHRSRFIFVAQLEFMCSNMKNIAV